MGECGIYLPEAGQRDLTSKRTVLPWGDMRKENWGQDQPFLEVPSTHLSKWGDHGSWPWGNKANSRALRQGPSKVLCAKGTLESCPKLPFLLPLTFRAQALFASTGLSGRDVGHPASDGRPAGVSLLPSRARAYPTPGGFIQATVGLPCLASS